MATRAHITSVDAISDFRASLIVYLSKAGPALEEITAEIVRTRMWLQGNQRIHWEGIHKRRARVLEEANAALFSSKLSNMREPSSAEQIAVTKAKRSLDEVEEKLKILKRWDREFDNRVEPLTRKLEKMHSILAEDLQEAVAHLNQVVGALDAYAGVIAPSAAEPQPAAPANSVVPDPDADKGGAS